MRADKSLRAEEAGGRRLHASWFYRFMSGAVELGEIARIEFEIQKSFPPAAPEPRCPSLHKCSSANWPGPKPH
jgi:hypothetical protein